MKKYFLILLLLSSAFISFPQVGLLSSNNKGIISSIDTLPVSLSSTISTNIVSSLREATAHSSNPPVTLFSDTIALFKNDVSIIRANSEKIRTNSYRLKNAKPFEKRRILTENKRLEKSNTSIGDEIASKTNIIKNKDTLVTSILSMNFDLMKQRFISKFDTSLAVMQNAKDNAYENYLLARDYKSFLDSTAKIKNQKTYSKGIATVQRRLIDLYENIKNHKSVLEIEVDKLTSINFNTVTKKFSPEIAKNTLDSIWNRFSDDTLKFSNYLKKDTSEFMNIIKTYNDLIKDQIILKETKEAEFGGLPQVTSILGKREVITQLQLYGSYTYQSKSTSTEGDLGLSFSPNSAPDTNNLYALFIPTASKYLINSSFTFGFWTTNHSLSIDNDSAKRLGIKIEFALAGKNLVFDTIKTIKSINNTVFYTKTGLEYGILPKRFSIYANVNTVTILDKAAEFKAATNLDSKFFGFIDCGAKFYLDPTGHSGKKDDGLFIYSNINAIINGGDVKRITKTDDLVIPSIQIGLVKRLGKF